MGPLWFRKLTLGIFLSLIATGSSLALMNDPRYEPIVFAIIATSTLLTLPVSLIIAGFTPPTHGEICSKLGCSAKAQVSRYVWHKGVVPLCKKCNQRPLHISEL